MTLDKARNSFRENLTNRSAGEYLEVLMSYEADGIIGDDTFRAGLAEIRHFLFVA